MTDSGATAQASVAESSVTLPPALGSASVTTFPFPTLPDASAFDPEAISILSDVFEDAWQALHTSGTTLHLGGRRSKQAKCSHVVLLSWRSLANETGIDYETRPSRTLQRQM
jgi:hypothetical protein